MNSSWLSSRKDIFLRNLITDFFDAKLYFDKIHRKYKEFSFIPYKLMDAWVGSENKKGPLWSLKDQSHRLFRNNLYKSSLYEHLFDWTLGSIFHEAIKLKEDSYQVESYKPLLDVELNSHKNDKALSEIINEYFFLIEKARNNLKDDLKSIDELFGKAIFHLREIIIASRENILLLRLLLENKRTFEKIFGNKSCLKILNQMFPDGIKEAYLLAADNCNTSGRFHEAQEYLKKAVELDPVNKTARKLMKELQDKEE